MSGNVQYYNLIGGLNTLQGIGTINQSPKKTDSPDMKNVEFYKLGGLISMKGNTLYGNQITATEDDKEVIYPISLGYEYIQGNNKYLIVCTTGGYVYEYDRVSDSYVQVYKFPTATLRHSIASFQNGIIISNGVDDLVYYCKNRHQDIGTVSITTGQKTVVGEGTTFLTDLSAGDYVTFGTSSTKYKVDSVEDDTHLTLDEAVTEDYLEVLMYLSELSECNAVYTNSEDENINRPVRGLALQTYNGRIFVGANDGVLYYSEVGLIHGWDMQHGAGAIPQFYNDNSDFTALAPWDKYLLLCKRERSYLLDGNSADDQQWVVQPYSPYTCDSQQSYVDINNGLYIYSRKAGGIYPMLQRTIYSPNYQGVEASQKIKDSFQYINTARYDYIFPVYHPRKKYIMFYIPLLTGIGSNSCFVYDTTCKAWLYREVPQEVTIAFQFNDEIYIGTKDGKILKEFFGNTFDNNAIEFYWRSPWFSFGQMSNFLSTREFRVNMAEEDSNNFLLRIRRDGKDNYRQRKVSNDSINFTSLVWDIGYNQDEFNNDYSTTIKSYEVTDGTSLYYTKVEGEKDDFCVNAALFENQELTIPAGYAGVNQELIPTDKENGTTAERITNIGYLWNYNTRQYTRYTNGTDYLWIDWNVEKPIANIPCLISRKETVSGRTPLYGWKFPSTTLGGSGGYYNNLLAGKVVYTKQGEEGPNKWIWLRDAQGEIYNNANDNGYGVAAISSDLSTNMYQFKCTNTNSPLYTSATGLFGKLDRASLYDISATQTETTNTGSDLTQATTSTITNVIENEDGTYTITTPDGTFSNMGTPTDDGDTITHNAYTTSDTITPETIVYATSNMEGQLAEGTGLNSGTLLSNNKTVTFSLVGPYTFFSYDYFIKQLVVYSYTGNSFDVKDNMVYDRFIPGDDYDYLQSITDTIWADGKGEPSDSDYQPSTYGDNWVATRHVIKRFPIPDQFFNSLQIEFYGNTEDNALALYGFEIHGVQLEEVPW